MIKDRQGLLADTAGLKEGAGGLGSQAKRIALCGLLAALSIVVLFLGGLLPLATFLAPAVAGLLLAPLALEFGLRYGLTVWAGVGLLALFLVPDKELAMIFCFFLGYYPMLKPRIEQLRQKRLQQLVKLLLFNGAVFSMYGLLLFLFPVGEAAAELKGASYLFLCLLVLLANLTFFLYDLAVFRLRQIYGLRLRPLLFGPGR